jgi:hypothetical protein
MTYDSPHRMFEHRGLDIETSSLTITFAATSGGSSNGDGNDFQANDLF